MKKIIKKGLMIVLVIYLAVIALGIPAVIIKYLF